MKKLGLIMLALTMFAFYGCGESQEIIIGDTPITPPIYDDKLKITSSINSAAMPFMAILEKDGNRNLIQLYIANGTGKDYTNSKFRIKFKREGQELTEEDGFTFTTNFNTVYNNGTILNNTLNTVRAHIIYTGSHINNINISVEIESDNGIETFDLGTFHFISYLQAYNEELIYLNNSIPLKIKSGEKANVILTNIADISFATLFESSTNVTLEEGVEPLTIGKAVYQPCKIDTAHNTTKGKLFVTKTKNICYIKVSATANDNITYNSYLPSLDTAQPLNGYKSTEPIKIEIIQ